jgi:hypothetical protein
MPKQLFQKGAYPQPAALTAELLREALKYDRKAAEIKLFGDFAHV